MPKFLNVIMIMLNGCSFHFEFWLFEKLFRSHIKMLTI